MARASPPLALCTAAETLGGGQALAQRHCILACQPAFGSRDRTGLSILLRSSRHRHCSRIAIRHGLHGSSNSVALQALCADSLVVLSGLARLAGECCIYPFSLHGQPCLALRITASLLLALLALLTLPSSTDCRGPLSPDVLNGLQRLSASLYPYRMTLFNRFRIIHLAMYRYRLSVTADP